MEREKHRFPGEERPQKVRYKVVNDRQLRFAEIELGGDERELAIPAKLAGPGLGDGPGTSGPGSKEGRESETAMGPGEGAAGRTPLSDSANGELTLEDLNFWNVRELEKARGRESAPDILKAEGIDAADGERGRTSDQIAFVELDAGVPEDGQMTSTVPEREPVNELAAAGTNGKDLAADPPTPASSVLPPTSVPPSFDGVRYYSREQQFVMRARELAWHTEPEAPFAPFKTYWPTYDSMTVPQVKWYFYWREEVRSGRYRDTDLSYLFLYLYELINGIGWSSPVQGRELMTGVWQAYRGRYPKLDAYLREWLFDFSLVHGLERPEVLALNKIPKSLSTELKELEWQRRFTAEPVELNWEVLTDLLDVEPEKSRFFQEGGSKDMKTLAPKVVALADAYLGHKKGARMLHRFPPREVSSERYLFRTAVYDEGLYGRTVQVPLLQISSHAPLRAYVTSLVRLTENELRKLRGFRGRLKGVDAEPEMVKLVAGFLKKELAAAERADKAAKAEIRIDARKLRRLKQESDEVRDLLTVEEPVTDGGGDAEKPPTTQAQSGKPDRRQLQGDRSRRRHGDRPQQLDMFDLAAAPHAGGTPETGDGSIQVLPTLDPDNLVAVTGDGAADRAGCSGGETAELSAAKLGVAAAEAATAGNTEAPVKLQLYSGPSSNPDSGRLKWHTEELDGEWQELAGRLNGTHLEMLHALRHGGDHHTLQAVAEQAGSMPELLIDEINEAAMDIIGDLLIDGDAVLDDYIDMLDWIKR